MSGLYKLFTKILPIMMLICFISFGILNTFQTNGQPNLTYLNQETYNIGTEENPEYKELYTFDTTAYAENINTEKLEKSFEKTIDFETYTNVWDKFQAIWEDGYQALDVLKTIGNGVVLLIDTAILPINILLCPIRIISAILLTGMAIIGINTDNGQFICSTLNFFVEKINIPLIQTDRIPDSRPDYLANKTIKFYDNFADTWRGHREEIDITFQANNVNYTKIRIEKPFEQTGQNVILSYLRQDGYWIVAYHQNVDPAWDTNLQQINITYNYKSTENLDKATYQTLLHYGQDITPISNTAWQFKERDLQLTNNIAYGIYFKTPPFDPENDEYTGMIAEDGKLYYKYPNYNKLVYDGTEWINDNYSFILFETNANPNNTYLSAVNQILTFNAVKQ